MTGLISEIQAFKGCKIASFKRSTPLRVETLDSARFLLKCTLQLLLGES